MKREAWLDYLRVAAAIAVIGIHVSSAPFSRYGAVPSALWWVANAFNAGCRWAVPVFVMISGALLLRAPVDSISLFYKKKLTLFVRPLIFWSGFYGVIRVLVHGEHFWTVVRSILNGNSFYHMWYLYMFVGFILFIPFLGFTVHACSMGREKWGVFLGVSGLLLLLFWMHRWFQLSAFSFLWDWIPYVGYFFAGYYFVNLAPSRLGRVRGRWLILCFILVVSLVSIANLVGFWRGVYPGLGHVWGDPVSPLVIVESVCVYLLFLRLRPRFKPGVFMQSLSGACLGVYLVHPFVLMVVREFVDPMEYTSVLSLLLEYGLAVLVSFGGVWLVRQVPFMRKLI